MRWGSATTRSPGGRQRRQDGALGPLKSKKSRRVVPVGQVVIDTLASYLAAFPHEGPLFVDEIGEPLAYHRWRTVCTAAAETTAVDLTAHDLRHFHASALIAGGASAKQVQERLGQATAAITLETYAHLWPGDDDRTRDVIDAALSPLADSLRTVEASEAQTCRSDGLCLRRGLLRLLEIADLLQ